jgi:shikimate kinase
MNAIALIGYRACGKTTVGKLLARQLAYRFVDLDAFIEQRIAMPISRYFTAHGEAAFRDQETLALRAVLENPRNLILSTGGGCVLREENRAILREKSQLIVYLEVPISEIQRRLQHDAGQRPSLTGQSIVAEAPRVFAEREPLYRALAQHISDGNRAPDAVVRDLTAIVENLV